MPRTCANERASVLASPGKSSSRTCPSARKPRKTSSSGSRLPTTALSTSSRTAPDSSSYACELHAHTASSESTTRSSSSIGRPQPSRSVGTTRSGRTTSHVSAPTTARASAGCASSEILRRTRAAPPRSCEAVERNGSGGRRRLRHRAPPRARDGRGSAAAGAPRPSHAPGPEEGARPACRREAPAPRRQALSRRRRARRRGGEIEVSRQEDRSSRLPGRKYQDAQCAENVPPHPPATTGSAGTACSRRSDTRRSSSRTVPRARSPRPSSHRPRRDARTSPR